MLLRDSFSFLRFFFVIIFFLLISLFQVFSQTAYSDVSSADGRVRHTYVDAVPVEAEFDGLFIDDD